MKCWSYEGGVWEPLWPKPEMREGESWEDYIKSFGFYGTSSLEWGQSEGFYVEVFETQDDDYALVPHGSKEFMAEFAAVVHTPFRYYSVFVSSLPSLVRLIQELRPMLASEYEAFTMERDPTPE